MEHPEQGRLGSPDILHGTHIILPISFCDFDTVVFHRLHARLVSTSRFLEAGE